MSVEPKPSSIISASWPVGFWSSAGARHCQKKLWFQICAAVVEQALRRALRRRRGSPRRASRLPAPLADQCHWPCRHRPCGACHDGNRASRPTSRAERILGERQFGQDERHGWKSSASGWRCMGNLKEGGGRRFPVASPCERPAEPRSRRSAELVALHRVAQLIVGQLERRRRGALVPAAFLERGGEDRLFIFGDGEPEIGAAARVVGRRGRGDVRPRPVLRPGSRRARSSTRRASPASGRQGDSNGSNWIVLDRLLRILPAIDGALDDVAQLADVARPVVGLSSRASASVLKPGQLGQPSSSAMRRPK